MFSLRTPGDDHSGPSLDVYGLLLAEMSRPIICSAVLVDGSARLARPITDEGRRSPASPHLQRCSETSNRFTVLLEGVSAVCVRVLTWRWKRPPLI